MAKIYEGNLVAEGLKFGVVAGAVQRVHRPTSCWAGRWTLSSANGAAEDGIEVAWVPGAFGDPPVVARKMAESKNTTR